MHLYTPELLNIDLLNSLICLWRGRCRRIRSDLRSCLPAHPAIPRSSIISCLPSTHLLPPERAALCESSLAAGGLAENLRAAGADDDGLCVREDGSDREAAGALDVHEEGSWAWDESLELSEQAGHRLACG